MKLFEVEIYLCYLFNIVKVYWVYKKKFIKYKLYRVVILVFLMMIYISEVVELLFGLDYDRFMLVVWVILVYVMRNYSVIGWFYMLISLFFV